MTDEAVQSTDLVALLMSHIPWMEDPAEGDCQRCRDYPWEDDKSDAMHIAELVNEYVAARVAEAKADVLTDVLIELNDDPIRRQSGGGASTGMLVALNIVRRRLKDGPRVDPLQPAVRHPARTDPPAEPVGRLPAGLEGIPEPRPCGATAMTTDATETTPIERLTAAVQAYVNEISDIPRVVRGAVVAWEAMRYDEDGDDAYQLSYACMVGTTPSAAIGIFDLGRTIMLSHVVPAFTGDDDD